MNKLKGLCIVLLPNNKDNISFIILSKIQRLGYINYIYILRVSWTFSHTKKTRNVKYIFQKGVDREFGADILPAIVFGIVVHEGT